MQDGMSHPLPLTWSTEAQMCQTARAVRLLFEPERRSFYFILLERNQTNLTGDSAVAAVR